MLKVQLLLKLLLLNKMVRIKSSGSGKRGIVGSTFHHSLTSYWNTDIIYGNKYFAAKALSGSRDIFFDRSRHVETCVLLTRKNLVSYNVEIMWVRI